MNWYVELYVSFYSHVQIKYIKILNLLKTFYIKNANIHYLTTPPFVTSIPLFYKNFSYIIFIKIYVRNKVFCLMQFPHSHPITL